MNKYLLDTNVVSELRKRKPHGAVVAWLQTLRSDQVYLSAATRGELQAGIELTREQDPKKAGEIELWADQLSDLYTILPMDSACFREWGRLMHRQPDELIGDALIAATARSHGLIVATRNVQDFRQLGVEHFNPFRFSADPHSSGA
ncbi:MAG TPA: type II toxin-antitoxin system VapC family toxin [Candidatus Binatia bacterium]|jgi:predicted nucleic acid-binding protein